MALLTIFSAPKPFTNSHVATIQRNAIQSWLQLGPDVQVSLVGDEPGMAQVADEFGVQHLPDVRRNEWGTPLVSSIFQLAREASQSQLLAYLNGDIMVLPDFLAAARQAAAQVERFLMAGQRWNLDVERELDFSPGWAGRLASELDVRGQLYPPTGSDYFVFPRQLFSDMPDFAIGRAGWDNWMIYHARRSGWAVIDATPSVRVIHQNHDYSHLPGGQAHYKLEESYRNEALGGGYRSMYTLLEANRTLVNGEIRPIKPTLPRLLHRAEILLKGDERRGLRWSMYLRVNKLRRAIEGQT